MNFQLLLERVLERKAARQHLRNRSIHLNRKIARNNNEIKRVKNFRDEAQKATALAGPLKWIFPDAVERLAGVTHMEKILHKLRKRKDVYSQLSSNYHASDLS